MELFRVEDPRQDLQMKISKRLKIGSDKHYGRFVYTTSEIKAGEVLLIEEPFFYSIDVSDDAAHKRCAFCLSTCNSSKSLTCSACKLTTFCSEQCQQLSLHKTECTFIRNADKEDGYFLLMIHVLIKSIFICGGLEKLQKFVEGRDKTLTYLNTADNELEKLCCCLNLESGNFNQDIKFSKAYVETDNIKKFYKNDSEKFFLVKLIQKILGILNRNSFCIELTDKNSFGAIFPFASLINHSCSPNIERISIGKKTAFVCIRPIHKNEQLFICYRFDKLFQL